MNGGVAAIGSLTAELQRVLAERAPPSGALPASAVPASAATAADAAE